MRISGSQRSKGTGAAFAVGLRHRAVLLISTHQREKEEFVKIQAGLFARRVLGAVSVVALVGLATVSTQAQTKKTVTIGITLPLTGSDAQSATLIKNGAQMAIDEANPKGTVPGYKIETIALDSGTATAGQYDPAQPATNTKKLVSNTAVVAND